MSDFLTWEEKKARQIMIFTFLINEKARQYIYTNYNSYKISKAMQNVEKKVFDKITMNYIK
jgi:hypothetical protein